MDALEFFGGLYRSKPGFNVDKGLVIRDREDVVHMTSQLGDQIPGVSKLKSRTQSLEVKVLTPKLPEKWQDRLEALRKEMVSKAYTQSDYPGIAPKLHRLKAVGTHHSQDWSDIAPQDEKIIETGHLNTKIPLHEATALIAGEDGQDMCCFEAGATLQKIQKVLWEPTLRPNTAETSQVLLNQTGCENLSLDGTVATAAHGNGLNKPIIADMVLSFRLLTVRVGVNGLPIVLEYQIEPQNGITDQEAFLEMFPDVVLIQDNDIFNATLVNIGCFGVVYSYIIKVQPAFYLKENRKMMTWVEAQNELPNLYNRNLNENDPLHSFEIFVCPYPPMPETDIQVVICTLEEVEGPPQGQRPKAYFIQAEWLRESFVTACNHLPEIVPFMICILMQATQCTDVVMDAVEALDPISGLAVTGQVTVSECAMETHNAADVIEKIDALIDLYQTIREENSGQLATTPFALRFSRSSDAHMAMQLGRQSVMIISNILKDTPNAENTLEQFRDLMRQFGGRPHWGMVNTMNAEKLNEIYPPEAIGAFQNAFDQFDPNGFFRNDFTKRVFGRVPEF